MELIDRYVYAVTKRLPAEQRADIEKELRGLIEDMLAEHGSAQVSEEAAVTEVLKKLGYPAILAARYRGAEQHLIGPELYFLYTFVLKIVLLATGGGLLIAMIVNLFVQGVSEPLKLIGETISSIVTGLIGAFGGVTLVFAAIERYSPEKIDLTKEEPFDPRDLPEVPQKRDRIHPSDPIVSMVFILIAMVLASYVPRFVGIFWTSDPGSTFIPLFNAPVYWMYLPFILITLALSMVREIAKLVAGRWTLSLTILSLVVEIPSLILTIVMFSNPDLLSDTFFNQIFTWLKRPDPLYFDLPLKLFISRVVIGLGIFGFVVETIKTGVQLIKKVTCV